MARERRKVKKISLRFIRQREGKLLILFVIMFGIIAGKLIWWQFVKGAELSQKAENNRTWDIPVEAKRGSILDRNLNELAISISADSVYAEPAYYQDKTEEARESAQILARTLGINETDVYESLMGETSFRWIKRKIDAEQSEILRTAKTEPSTAAKDGGNAKKLAGIGMTEESRRNYPNGSTACHIVGISGTDNTGLEGIDLYYDEQIGGIDGKIIVEHDGIGRELPDARQNYEAPIEGNDLVLTIDASIQHFAEQELKNIMDEWKAERACAIVMDPKNMEILALANTPAFDPNHYADYPDEYRRNFAVNDNYEPGSTMKTITLAMALDSGVADMNNFSYYCGGSVQMGEHEIKCSEGAVHGQQTLSQIFENSCNGGFIRLGLMLGKDRYYQYLDKFGFGKRTGIDLPGETSGILVNQEKASNLDLGIMAMGQTNAVTPIQLITAVSAIANGGTLYKPHLVKEIRDQEGNVIEEVKPEVVSQVISREAAKSTLRILENEVLYGTGKKAQLEGYRIGGKTGTANKIKDTGGYYENNYIVSFVGVAPIDDPKLVCLVVVDSPKGDLIYGSWIAAPAVREIFRSSLRYLGEPMDEEALDENGEERQMLTVPNVVNLTKEEARSVLEARGFNVSEVGDGDTVWEQTPRANTRQYSGSYVKLSTISRTEELETGNITVPDLYGKTKRDVANILAELELYMAGEGFGTVIEQSPQPGQTVGIGQTVKVIFKGSVQDDETFAEGMVDNEALQQALEAEKAKEKEAEEEAEKMEEAPVRRQKVSE